MMIACIRCTVRDYDTSQRRRALGDWIYQESARLVTILTVRPSTLTLGPNAIKYWGVRCTWPRGRHPLKQAAAPTCDVAEGKQVCARVLQ